MVNKLTKRERELFDLLQEFPLITTKELQNKMKVGKSFISQYIDRLKKKGYILNNMSISKKINKTNLTEIIKIIEKNNRKLIRELQSLSFNFI